MSKTDTSLQRRPNRAVLAAGERQFPTMCQVEDRIALLKENLASDVSANRLPGATRRMSQRRDNPTENAVVFPAMLSIDRYRHQTAKQPPPALINVRAVR